MKVKFGKVLSPTEFIQKVIYDGNGKFVLDGKFVKGTKIMTHVLSAFLLEDHENKGRIGAGIGMNNTCFQEFLQNFLNFIFLSKGMIIRRTLGGRLPGIKGMEWSWYPWEGGRP
jgi:hypothetical protein